MVISDRHNYAFILTPHTGSTAIRAELEAHYAGRRVERARKHAELSEHPELEIGPDGTRRIIFCGVRNPLDVWITRFHRLRSNHHGLFTSPEHWAENGGWISKRKRQEFEFVQILDHNFSDYVLAFPNAMKKLAGRAVAQADFRIRYERLQDDFAAMLRRLGLEPSRPVPVRNATAGRKDYTDRYSAEARAVARAHLQPLMENWGYEFPADFR